MRSARLNVLWCGGVGSVFLVPALHPLFISVVGVPSHLLWWVHVLPVALFTFRGGRSYAVGMVLLSAGLVAWGEWLFGNGYGMPASAETILALTVALTGTNVLVAGFALHARKVTERYRLLFGRVRMGVLQVDSAERIVGANPAAAEILGLSESSDVVGSSFSSVFTGQGLGSLATLEERGGWTGQLEVSTSHGRRTVHSVLAAAHDEDTDTYQVFLGDRSTEVMQEQELQRQARLSSLGEALAGVAHELNNPLASILAHVQLARMHERLDDETREALEVVEHEAGRMKKIARELVSFSRQEERVEHAEVDEVLRRIVRVQRITLGRRVQITTDLRAETVVEASPLKIEQIVLNLLSNAAYAVKRHGGSRVMISSRLVNGHVEVEVSDDGPGIDPEVRGRLFEPFLTTKPDGEGTGLGLAISRRLARASGGDLDARDLEPRGAAFTLRLRPASVGAAQVAHVTPVRPPEGRALPAAPAR